MVAVVSGIIADVTSFVAMVSGIIADVKDVECVIKGFSCNKAPGHDKITAQVLKDSLSPTLPAITCIMNNSFNTRTFARQWKIAEATPVLKSGDFEDPCNNRPISLLPILSKVSERLVHRQLVDYLTKKKKLAKSQGGNSKLHSTETALLCVTDDLLLAMDSKKVSVVVLLDMSKASIAFHILFYAETASTWCLLSKLGLVSQLSYGPLPTGSHP